MKKRIDLLLLERELVESRQKAQALIMAGQILVNNCKIDKVGKSVAVDSEIRVLGEEHPYVSRGGVKMETALKAFAYSPEGQIAMDIGASTGGFTDCLLQHGATHVYAVDVGYGQLAWKLQQDERVTSLERTNARHLKFEQIGCHVDLVVIDASFISLKLLIPTAHLFLKPDGVLIALIKPQFEAGKEHIGKKGLVDSEEVRLQIIEEIKEFATRLGMHFMDVVASEIVGKKSGNQEYLIAFQKEA